MAKVKIINPQIYKDLLKTGKPTYRVVPLDATWYMPNVPKNGKDEFLNQSRLPGAGFFDLDEIALPKSPYPHMLANYDTLNRSLNNIGLNRTDKLVFYDKSGIFSSPRAAWNLILAGHKQVYLLDHFKDYEKDSLPLDTEKIASTATDVVEVSLEYDMIEEEQYEQNYKDQVIEYEELYDLASSGELAKQYVVFDARSTPRFTGEADEPRPGLSSGHIPSSLSLPFTKVLTENGNFKPKEEIIDLFKQEFDIDLTKALPDNKKFIVMCGTGVTAVILRLAIESVAESKTPIRVYDGSWTEWAQRAPPELIEKSV